MSANSEWDDLLASKIQMLHCSDLPSVKIDNYYSASVWIYCYMSNWKEIGQVCLRRFRFLKGSTFLIGKGLASKNMFSKQRDLLKQERASKPASKQSKPEMCSWGSWTVSVLVEKQVFFVKKKLSRMSTGPSRGLCSLVKGLHGNTKMCVLITKKCLLTQMDALWKKIVFAKKCVFWPDSLLATLFNHDSLWPREFWPLTCSVLFNFQSSCPKIDLFSKYVCRFTLLPLSFILTVVPH